MVDVKGALLKVPADIFAFASEMKYQYDYAKKFRDAKCIYINGSEVYLLPCRLSSNLMSIYPKNINRRFAATHMYTLRPNNVPFFIIYNNNPETLRLGQKPKEVKVKRQNKIQVVKDDKEGNPVIAEQIKIDEYYVPGADRLTAIAYDFAVSNMMKALEPALTNRERIITAAFGFLTGIVLTLGYIGYGG